MYIKNIAKRIAKGFCIFFCVNTPTIV